MSNIYYLGNEIRLGMLSEHDGYPASWKYNTSGRTFWENGAIPSLFQVF